MRSPGTILILLYLIVALWTLTAVAASLATFLYYRNARRLRKPPNQPQAVVLAPVKGASPTLDQFTAALLAQDYQQYRVIFIVESTSDPAYWPLADAAGLSGGRARLIVAGEAVDGGQKVHNLAAALRTLRPEDEIVVFADGDFAPATDWLTQLTRPVVRGRAEISTGYVIMVPRSPRPANILASLISLG
ncbi:MAG TPA: glycosyltransferase family 2 protein, partial [Propylenella sp.]|nr:glycosyltransferase family 2 protein [Propylenella sp.]